MQVINRIVRSSLNDKDDAARIAAIYALSAMGGSSDIALLARIANKDLKLGISARYAAEELKKRLAAKAARKRDHGVLSQSFQ